jgi:putative signal transducing protein
VSWLACWSAPAPEAHLVKGFLEQRGVPCVLRSDGPSIYPVPAFGLRVLVPEDWLPVARKFLERRRRRTSRVLPLVPPRRRG